ncbi:MAG TPA: PIG-L family deacetylase [Bryobacteraceae bacterium]|nr:PIG-L family deacetylase [Bryobacteraceae bacterium]
MRGFVSAGIDQLPKALLVVAHPDDEYAVAATVYRITHELGGTVDQVIVTNGEGGYRYSQLAEAIYGATLTDEVTGRSRLPEIRKREVREAGRILGIRKHYFLEQRDSSFNTDAAEPLNGLWDLQLISSRLRRLLKRERYDYVFVLLPTSDTHGHHQAVALLAIEEVMRLPEDSRPVVLGAHAGQQVRFRGQFARFVVDRRDAVAQAGSMTYHVVVNWVIAAHKSQGLFQMDAGKHHDEQFWILATGTSEATAHADQLFAQLTPEPIALHAYAS